MTTKQAIGRRIRARRQRLRLSQQELGRLVGTSRTAVCLLEHGVGNVRGLLPLVAQALEVDEGWLRE